MKTKLHNRILSALLAVLTILSCLPMFTFAELFPAGFEITHEGKHTSAITFYDNEKVTVAAENLPEGSTCQWQIQIPGTEIWVDIQGQTEPELGVSLAVVGSLLDENDSAYVRCAAVGGEPVYTDVLKVTVTEETVPETSAPVEETENTEVTVAPTGEAVEETSAPTEQETDPDVTEETVPEITEETIPETTEPATEAPAPTEGETVPETSAPAEETESTEATTAPTEKAVEETSAPTEADVIPEATEETETAEETIPETTEAPAPMLFAMPRSTDVATAAEESGDDTGDGTDPDAGTDTTDSSSSTDVSDTEFVTVTIHYRAVTRHNKFETTGADASVKDNAVVATAAADARPSHIFKGTDLDITIPCHVMPGYSLVIPSYYTGNELTVDGNNLKVNLKNVTEDMDLYVYYKEQEVSYTARYFIQNVYNDLYTEDTTILTPEIQAKMKGYPGDEPTEEIIYPEKYGFTALFFQPDTIAADGSTVFEVYYDRNYYLINFNMDGGYGTVPVYARYETVFTVSPPTKTGWSFNGWTETHRDSSADRADVADAAFALALKNCIDGIPKFNGRVTKIPFSNMTYKANWIQGNTTYTVTYWIDNDLGADTYIGSEVLPGVSGQPITGFKELGTTIGVSPIICGKTGHTHTEACRCSHTHTPAGGCYADFGNSTTDCPYAPAFNGLGQQNHTNEEPRSGYAYKLEKDGQATQYVAVYRAIQNNGKAGIANYYTITEDNLGAQVESITVDGYTLTKYYAKLSCNHVHTSACNGGYLCGTSEHAHTVEAGCYQDTRYMNLVRSDLGKGKEVTNEVIIDGDGSTVLNVYYQYKEYTLRFYYASSIVNNGTTEYYVVGGSTNYFGANGHNTSDDITLLNNMFVSHSDQCGKVNALPTLNTAGLAKNYVTDSETSGNRTYYYISFKARYGDDISQMWPCDVFNVATRTNPNSSGWTSPTAVASGWNGEHHVAYCYKKYTGTDNQTIKGIYEKLDEKILFKEDVDDESTVSYLCFWENGDDTSWSIPELYIYKIWLPCIDNKETNAPFKENSTTEKKETKQKDGIWYYLEDFYNTIDNSTINEQTCPSLTGFKEKSRDWSVYFMQTDQKKESENYPEGSTLPEGVQQYDYWLGDDKKYGPGMENGVIQNYVYNNSYYYPKPLTVDELNQNIGYTYVSAYKYLLYDEERYNPAAAKTADDYLDHTKVREAYDVNFYYTRNIHKLNFWNYNGWLNSGDGVQGGVAYDASLSKYFEGVTVGDKHYDGANAIVETKYPEELEPGAYRFEDWYISPEFQESTRVNWQTMTMPDEDLTVYAHWVPITYNTYFYMDYERYEAGTYFHQTSDTPHGTNIEASQLNAIRNLKFKDKNDTQIDKYRFVNWFYIDTDGTKKAFNPSEMAVRKELRLFAEWTTSIVQEYEVSYVYGRWDETQGKYVPATDTPFELTRASTGYALEATTKTFTALPKDKLTQFPLVDGNDSSGKLWLPHTNSHSIVMRATETTQVDGKPVTVNPNVYTFYYVVRKNVNYTVKYLDAATGKPVATEVTKNVDYALVTETFKYIEDYIPDAFHKRLVLSANENENEIVFYYTKDDDDDPDAGGSGSGTDKQRSRYLIVHHYQEIQDGASSEVATYEEFEESGLDYVGNTATAVESGRVGFVFDEKKTKAEYLDRFGENLTETEQAQLLSENVKQNDASKWTVSGIVTTGADQDANKPLELHLYYTRGTYGYTVQHCDWDTKQIIELKGADGNDQQQTQTGTATLGSTITLTSLTIPGYDVYAPDEEDGSSKTLPLKISHIESQNVVTFYYVRKKVTVEYIPICTDTGITSGFGGVSNPLDYDLQTPRGSQAAAESGFHFMGWYTSQTPDAQKRVTDKALLAPTDIKISPDIYDYTYYAIFKPITLTISQTGIPVGETALYQITGNGVNLTVALPGKGSELASVTVEQIPAGEYTVTELTGWTWKNGTDLNSKNVTVSKSAENVVSFAFTIPASDWLHGETHKENNFAKVTNNS